VEEDREEEDVPDPLIFGLHQRRRVGSRAASDGGALEHAPQLFLSPIPVQKGSLAISDCSRTVL